MKIVGWLAKPAVLGLAGGQARTIYPSKTTLLASHPTTIPFPVIHADDYERRTHELLDANNKLVERCRALTGERDRLMMFVRSMLRPKEEWQEHHGPVLWWKYPIEEPPYVGSPLDTGMNVEVTVGGVSKVYSVGGWPGYHTHWTPLPIPTPMEVTPS